MELTDSGGGQISSNLLIFLIIFNKEMKVINEKGFTHNFQMRFRDIALKTNEN